MKSFFAILYLPLWALVAIWVVFRRKKALDEKDLAMRAMLLDDIFYSLPVPEGKIEEVLIRAIIEYIDREKSALLAMTRIGVSGVGVLPK
ncbi:MAG: hypothetical protein WHV66_04125 [Anaerolineales bacterium]|jgi:hypothetical protein